MRRSRKRLHLDVRAGLDVVGLAPADVHGLAASHAFAFDDPLQASLP